RSSDLIMMSDIWSVNGINSQKPLPHASMTCGTVDGVQMNPATTTTTVAMSAKIKASGTHRSVQSVIARAMRARNPGCSGGSSAPSRDGFEIGPVMPRFCRAAARGSTLQCHFERRAGLFADVIEAGARLELDENEAATLFYLENRELGDDEVHDALAGHGQSALFQNLRS